MAKIEPLADIGANYASITKINANMAKIEAAIENTVSRDGSTPNFMTAPLDMNSQKIINVLEPVSAGDVATKNYVDTIVGAVTGLVTPIAHTWAKLTDGMLTLDTYAQLTALSAPGENVTYRVRGRTTKGDGGEGSFYFVSGSAATANDGTILTHASGRFFRLFDSGKLNVKWFGATGSGAGNDATAINAAITALGASGGDLFFPPGNYRVTSTINANVPVHLIGLASGSVYQPVQSSSVTITWAGSAGGNVVQQGGFGTLISGGGIRHIKIDGAAIASYGLVIKDSQRGYFQDVTITGATVGGLLMQNTVSLDPTGFHTFDDLRIQLRGGSTNSANGIIVSGTNAGGAEGVTLCTFRRCRIDHANGAGVLIGAIGDGFTWESLLTFRADVETGDGVWFVGTGTTICGSHVFLNPSVTAGFRFDDPQVGIQTQIINANHLDINTGVGIFNIMRGAGASLATGKSALGFAYGMSLLEPIHAYKKRDNCALIRHDTANTTLHTADGNWRTRLDGTGSILANGQPGSGLDLTAGNVNGNITAMFDNATIGAGEGYGTFYGMAGQWLVAPVASTNCVMRFGWADGLGASPTNGIYLEYAPGTSANWRLVTVSGGVATTVTSSVAVQVSAKQEIYLFVRPGSLGVTAYFRAANNTLYALIGSSTTNIPTSPMSAFASVRTLENVVKRVDVYGIKIGATDEV